MINDTELITLRPRIPWLPSYVGISHLFNFHREVLRLFWLSETRRVHVTGRGLVVVRNRHQNTGSLG